MLETIMLETPRLILRPYTLDDFEPFCAMTSDPDVLRFIGRQPLSREDVWGRLLRYAGHWALLGHGIFAVIEKETGLFVGETGLADCRRGLGAQFDGVGEAAWVFARRAQGLGYGTEAAAAAHRWYDGTQGRVRTVCLIHPENGASLRLAQKLGYQAFDRCTYKDDPAIMLERF